MKIALLAPLEERVPPEKYGGTERVIYALAEGLVGLGHDVTLLASGDSHTSARLIPCVESHLRPYLKKNQRLWLYLQWHGFHRALDHLRSENYDIVHNHGDWPFLIASAYTDAPVVTTIHNPVQFQFGVKKIYQEYPYVSISDSQRDYLPKLDYIATVYHGIKVEEFEFNDTPGDYLAFLSRIHPDKGPLQAIEIAKATGSKLIIAAKIDPPEINYYRRKIRPLIDGQQIIFIGEVGHEEKVKLLKNARALLSPLQWDEPFGIVTIEAMACGTPVITTPRGSMPEIIEDGKTGFLCRDSTELIAAVGKIDTIDRKYCRRHVEKTFTARKMAQNYIKVFDKLLKRRKLKRNTT